MKHNERLFFVRIPYSNHAVLAQECPVELLENACIPVVHDRRVHFSDKKDAKALRAFIGKGAVVSRGPDHIGKHGHRVARMRRQPKGE